MRVIQALLVGVCLLFAAACSKPLATEAPASKAVGVVRPQATSPVATTKPAVTQEPAPKGPAILTLRANGAILDPEGKAFGSRDDAEKFLKEERTRTKEPSIPFRAERDADAAKVRQALLLYQRAGFQGVELRAADADDKKKGPVVSLPRRTDPENKDAPLAFFTQIAVIVNVNGTGSQANQVREVILKTPSGETGFGRSEWREQLPKAIKALIDGQELTIKDACDIQADGRLCYEGLLEVVDLCAKAGVKRIRVSAFAKKPGDDSDEALEFWLPATGAAKRPEPAQPVAPAKPAEVKVVVKSAEGQIAELLIRAPGGDSKIGTLKELEERLKAIRPKLRNQTDVTIEADSGLRYAFVIATMDACLKAGFTGVGFAPPPPPDKGK